MQVINARTKNWLENASPKEISAFLARGRPDVAKLMNKDTMEMVYRPAVSGVLIGNENYENEGEAIEEAEREVERRGREEDLPRIDEEWLGIYNIELSERAFETPFRTSRIVHLGTSLLVDESLRVLDDLDIDVTDPDELPEELRTHMVYEEDEDGEDPRYIFCESLKGHGINGFIVEVQTPVPQPQDHGIQFSWARFRSSLFYGETFREAVGKGEAWAKSIWDEAWAKGNQTANQQD